MDIWCIYSENETARYITIISNGTNEKNWMHNRKIRILCEGGIQYVLSTIKHNGNNKWPHRTIWENVHQFLDYMATNPNVVVRFHASDMILRADTNASYLTEPEARSRAAGYFILGSIPLKYTREHTNNPINVNCNISIFCCLCCRRRNWRVFCDRKRCHNHTKKY